MVEPVIWDFGGVLTTSPFEAFARFESERGLPTWIIADVIAGQSCDSRNRRLTLNVETTTV
jgi:hypothetical protein